MKRNQVTNLSFLNDVFGKETELGYISAAWFESLFRVFFVSRFLGYDSRSPIWVSHFEKKGKLSEQLGVFFLIYSKIVFLSLWQVCHSQPLYSKHSGTVHFPIHFLRLLADCLSLMNRWHWWLGYLVNLLENVIGTLSVDIGAVSVNHYGLMIATCSLVR